MQKKSLKIKITLCLALTSFCILILGIDCLAQQRRESKPDSKAELEDIEIDEENVWDFGDVAKEEVLNHAFTLKNEFGMILRIFKVSTTCGCIVSKAKKNVLMPDEETTIEVVFDTKEYFGSVFHIIYVETNRFIDPVIMYKIKANVVRPRIRKGMR